MNWTLRTLAASALLLLLASTAYAVDTGSPRLLGSFAPAAGTVAAADTGGTGGVATSLDASLWTGGSLLVQAFFADTTSADSAAFEVFLNFGMDSKNTADSWYPWDSDDSNQKRDGFFLTTMDSTALTTATMLTPLTGSLATVSKYPNYVSSRVLFGQVNALTANAGTVAIPGGAVLKGWTPQAGPGHGESACWVVPLSDAFGGQIAARSIRAIVLNRHPRVAPSFINIYYVPRMNTN